MLHFRHLLAPCMEVTNAAVRVDELSRALLTVFPIDL